MEATRPQAMQSQPGANTDTPMDIDPDPNTPLSLTNTLDVEGKIVKWDGLKSELQRVGLEPNKLYHGKPAPKETSSAGFSNPLSYFVIDHESNHTSMLYEELQQLQAAARAPLPTGQEILSRII